MKITKNKLKQLIKEQYEADMLLEGVPLSQSGGARQGEFTSSLRGRVAAKNIPELNSNIEALERRMTKIEDMLEQMAGEAGKVQMYEEGLRPDVFQEVMDELDTMNENVGLSLARQLDRGVKPGQSYLPDSGLTRDNPVMQALLDPDPQSASMIKGALGIEALESQLRRIEARLARLEGKSRGPQNY